MQYNTVENEYICINNVKLKCIRSFKRKTLNNFSYLVDVYESKDCTGCKYINECKRTNKNKVLQVSTDFYKFRSMSLNNIKSQKGIILRINQSIQAEGVFAKIKESRMFRRFTYRGFVGVTPQTIFLVLAFNILNYASKKLK